jgi:AAA15 family ATPase/GTPase
MYIRQFRIQNFKSIKDITFHLNDGLNILTGINNSGKTTVLQALSLWHECFTKLIKEGKKEGNSYRRGDFVLENGQLSYSDISSVRSAHFDDIYHERDRKLQITLEATFADEDGEKLSIGFVITGSGSNYEVTLLGSKTYNYRKFNDYFRYLPTPFAIIYGTPVAQIQETENFTTDPGIKEKVLLRQSFSVFRNRLYRVLRSANTNMVSVFMNDLNYILYNNEQKIVLRTATDMNADAQAVILYRQGASDVEKDISLLGSGTLQIIEILLNLYNAENDRVDYRMILLDEPDSHIHRDIQRRLVEVFLRYSSDSQLFLSTHNESLIRSAAPQHVFHMTGKPEGEVRSIHFDTNDQHLGLHFKGIMPSNLTPVIRSIGNTTGLDFINALECDRLIFVEGEDDARVFRILLNQQINNQKKYMFWVLGGIGEVLENINAYKTVFSTIKNSVTLWDKAALVFDKDELSVAHKDIILDNFREKLGIKTYCANAYTFEATLLSDLPKTAKLLRRLVENATGTTPDIETILQDLTLAYRNYGVTLKAKFNDEYYRNAVNRYLNSKIKKVHELFGPKIINIQDLLLLKYIETYFGDCLANELLYQLMDKRDVENVIKQTIEQYGLVFSIESDFIELIKLVDKSTWIAEWDFLNKL